MKDSGAPIMSVSRLEVIAWLIVIAVETSHGGTPTRFHPQPVGGKRPCAKPGRRFQLGSTLDGSQGKQGRPDRLPESACKDLQMKRALLGQIKRVGTLHRDQLE
jgi:hypothetical protein